MIGILPKPFIILLFIITSVLFIVTDQRFAFEQRLRLRYGIDRDWWIPPIALAIAFAASVVEPPAIRTAFFQKFDILMLIFSFGIMSEGLGKSGFFRHIAYKIVDKCQGNTARLILYMYIMTSIATFFTTNDIVVLVITPIIVAICFQAAIRNTKLILLSQFIAANTLSMGLLIGSPTNIIISEQMSIDFFSYLALMVLPAVVAFVSSFVLINQVMKIARSDRFSLFDDLAFQRQYSMPEANPEPYFTAHMRDWLLIFGTFVVLVAIVTFIETSLLWCAVPSMLISFVYWYRSDEHEVPLRESVKNLPYGIFFFGMTFFIFAEQFAQSNLMNGTLIPFLQQFFAGQPVRASVVGVFGSGMMVNMFNDLPAAALVAQMIAKVELQSFATRHILIQGSLIGLNIGTYVTQVGALAGLIWFNQLRVQRTKQRDLFPNLADDMRFPKRMDLLRFGLLHFFFTGLLTATFLIFEWVLVSFLVGPYTLG
jgi:arsenical pump membrane protein